MKVFIEGMNGLRQDILSDDQGKYEFRGISGGRYQIHATNPNAPEHYCDPIEADTARAFSGRLQVDVNLKLPLHKEKKDANLSLSRYEPAKQCLEEALKPGQESAARAHVYLAEVFAHEQKFKEAADLIRWYLTLKPDAADAASLRKMESDWRARAKATKVQN